MLDERKVETRIWNNNSLHIDVDSSLQVATEMKTGNLWFSHWSINSVDGGDSIYKKNGQSRLLFTAKRYPFYPIIDTFHFYSPLPGGRQSGDVEKIDNDKNGGRSSKNGEKNGGRSQYLKRLLVNTGDKLSSSQLVADLGAEPCKDYYIPVMLKDDDVSKQGRKQYLKDEEYRQASKFLGYFLGLAYGCQAFIISMVWIDDIPFYFNDLTTFSLFLSFSIAGAGIATIFPYHLFPLVMALQIILFFLPTILANILDNDVD
jgi:hypothetical protein